MTTPAGPRDPDPIDGQVRQLLWRLRARLVNPPAEEHTHADLDRLFAAAAEHAHELPSSGAHPAPGVQAGAPSPEQPLEVAASQPAPVQLDDRRRRWLTGAVGRVAAAMVMVVTVGTGAVAARDGAVSLPVLFGGTAQDDALALPEVDGQDPGAVVPPADAADASDDPDELGDLDPDDLHAQQPDDGLPATDEDADGASATDPDEDAASRDAGTEEATSDGGQGDDATSGSNSSDSNAPGGGADRSRGQGESSSEGGDPGSDREVNDPTEEVLAAPQDPNVFDGFGGPRPCDGDDGVSCLPDGRSEAPATDSTDTTVDSDPATPTSPTAPTTDPATPSTPTAETVDEFAERRFEG